MLPRTSDGLLDGDTLEQANVTETERITVIYIYFDTMLIYQ